MDAYSDYANSERKEENEWKDEEKHEECGIVAIYSKKGKDVAHYLYQSLVALQHRGQDAAGFAVYGRDGIKVRKSLGLVSEIFREEDFKLKGSLGIGHTRYPTCGTITPVDVQPSVHDNVAVAHNGHIANYNVLRKSLEKKYEFKNTVDSEVIALLLKEKLDAKKDNGRKDVETAIKHVMEKIDGAFSTVTMIDGQFYGFRDPHGLRPMVYGENDELICITSESAALDINGINHRGSIKQGWYVYIENNKLVHKPLMEKEAKHCMFEYVYFSRPDSIINDKWVYEVRKNLGEQLAKEHPVSADIVVPVPDTARTAAEMFARTTGIQMEEGLIKNRYIGRTFIMPSQDKRITNVKLKLNPVKQILDGKRVVLVDDSIVRGTTLREIVRMVKEAGAKEVHLRITCPPLRSPCFYGVDMATYKELIANNKSIDEIRKFLGADSLGYLSVEGLKKAIGLPSCTGCLTGEYITPYARQLAKEKKDDELRCG